MSNMAAAADGLDQTGEREDRDTPKECLICSFLQRSGANSPVFHRHLSSLYHRQISGAEDSSEPYLCPSCKNAHRPYQDQRLRVVVSDSTLHQFYAPPGYTGAVQYQGDQLHIDYLTIDSADIQTLMDAFKMEYLDFPPSTKPMDIVLVAGYQDLLAGHSRYEIIGKLHEFADLVKGKARELQLSHDVSNTVAIASLMYPPRLAWMQNDGPVPTVNYINQREKIDWLNGEIERLNRAYDAVNPPRFHTYGIRTSTMPVFNRFGRSILATIKSHRWDHWEGHDRAIMMRLKPERLFRMGSALNNYFQYNT